MMTSIVNRKEEKNRNTKLSQDKQKLLAEKIEQYGAYLLLLGVVLSLIFVK